MTEAITAIKDSGILARVQRIWHHPIYQEQFLKLQESEKTRVFCGHTLTHFLDVARIAEILNLENGYKIEKELIYAAALLHDIGRYRQIIDGTPHDQASAEICAQILPECGFSASELQRLQGAIFSHRSSHMPDADTDGDPLAKCLYLADKLSRNCFSCPAAGECNWPQQKRNLEIFI